MNSSSNVSFVPNKVDVNRIWSDRVESCYHASSTFAYEVTVPHQKSLGLNLKPHTLSCSIGAGTKRKLGCVIVVDAAQPLFPIVYPGDILLRVNDVSLITAPDQEFSFETTAKAITSATAPRTLRFMRPAGLASNMYPSAVEVLLLSTESNVIAKFTAQEVEEISNQSIKQEELNNSEKKLSYSNAFLDSTAPPAVKKMMLQNKVDWEYGPSIEAYNNTPLIDLQTNLVKIENMITHGTPSFGAGIYKDRMQFVAVLHTNYEYDKGIKEDKIGNDSNKCNNNVRTYFLGKFDTEDEAIASYNKAYDEYIKTGTYVIREAKRVNPLRLSLATISTQSQPLEKLIIRNPSFAAIPKVTSSNTLSQQNQPPQQQQSFNQFQNIFSEKNLI